MKNKGLFFFITVFVHALLYTQSPPDLQELIKSAIENDGTLQIQLLQNKNTELVNEQLEDIFIPKLELTGESGYIYTKTHLISPELTFPSLPGIFPEKVIPKGEFSNQLNISGISAKAKLEASVLIYSGGKVRHLKRANYEKIQSEISLIEKSKDEIVTAVAMIYDQLALVYETQRVLDESRKRLISNKNKAEKALGYGLITPYDYKKIELAEMTLDSKVIELEGKKELLVTNIHLITGVSRELILQIRPNLEPINYEVLNENIEERAEIKAMEHGIKAIDHKINAEKTWWIPKIKALSSLTYMGLYSNAISTDKDIIYGKVGKLDTNINSINVFPVLQVGVGFKWDIFDGNEGKHAIQESKIEKEILEVKRGDAIKKLKLNLINNQIQNRIAIAQIKVHEKSRKIAHKALENVEKEFRYGTKDSSELMEAENDFRQAELDYQKAIFHQRRSAIELMKATQNLNINKL